MEDLRDHLIDTWIRIPDEAEALRRGIDIVRRDHFSLLAYGRVGSYSNWLVPNRFEFRKDQIAEALKESFEFFESKATPYSVLVIDEMDKWLTPILKEQGFVLMENVEALVGNTKTSMTKSDFEVRQVQSREDIRIALSIDDSFEEHSERQFNEALESAVVRSDVGEEKWFLSYEKGKAVAMASLRLVSEPRHAYLSGATTKSAFRGHGHYTALLQKRLQIAFSVGTELAATHAVSDTSAPILKQFGFQPVGWLKVYADKRREKHEPEFLSR